MVFVHLAPKNQLYICVPSDIPDDFLYAWIPFFVNEFILLVLAVYKGVQSVKAHKDLGYVSRLIVFLVKGSVSYYIWCDLLHLSFDKCPYSQTCQCIWRFAFRGVDMGNRRSQSIFRHLLL